LLFIPSIPGNVAFFKKKPQSAQSTQRRNTGNFVFLSSSVFSVPSVVDILHFSLDIKVNAGALLLPRPGNRQKPDFVIFWDRRFL
jgi:hypothetical protein